METHQDAPCRWFLAGLVGSAVGVLSCLVGSLLTNTGTLMVGVVLLAIGSTTVALAVLKGRDDDRAAESRPSARDVA